MGNDGSEGNNLGSLTTAPLLQNGRTVSKLLRTTGLHWVTCNAWESFLSNAVLKKSNGFKGKKEEEEAMATTL